MADLLCRREPERLRDAGVDSASTDVFAHLISKCQDSYEADEDAIAAEEKLSTKEVKLLLEHPMATAYKKIMAARRPATEAVPSSATAARAPAPTATPRASEYSYQRLKDLFYAQRGFLWGSTGPRAGNRPTWAFSQSGL